MWNDVTSHFRKDYSRRSLEIAELPPKLLRPPYLRCISRQRFCKRCFLAEISGGHLSEREELRSASLLRFSRSSRQSRKPARRILGLFNYINRDLHHHEAIFLLAFNSLEKSLYHLTYVCVYVLSY